MSVKAKVDPKSPWCMVVFPRGKHDRVKAVRMVGNNKRPGAGSSAYLHIEGCIEQGQRTALLTISRRDDLRAIAEMILAGLK